MASSSTDETKTPKLRVENLAKSYNNLHALRPTSLEVGNGEFLTLLGPSGSGKTTLLMMVAGLTAPSGGDIWIDGRQSTDIPPQQRDIGVVFQNYALFPHLSVYENIAFPLRMRRMPAKSIESEVRRVLDIVDLPQMADRLPRELSGGQQQRVALARCAVYGPSIILMDEPLGALDKKLRDTMQMEIKRLHRELGATILYVTHDQGEAMSMSDRICLMRNGGIEQLGTPADLYHRPVNRFVGDFLGGATFFSAEVTGAEGTVLVLKAFDDVVIRARKPEGDATIGETALCMVRPQHFQVCREAPPSLNSIPVTIRSSVLTGTMTEHHAHLSDGSPLTAVELTNPGTQVLEVGAQVRVSWRPDDTIVFIGDAVR